MMDGLTRALHALRLRRDGGEGGAAAVWFAILGMSLFMLAGLVIDGGLTISKREQAYDIAEQAARAAADQIDLAELRDSNQIVIDPELACARAAEIIELTPDAEPFGCDPDPGAVTVAVRITFDTTLLGILVDQFTVEGSATAEPQEGIAGPIGP